jgi:hypothetical protein
MDAVYIERIDGDERRGGVGNPRAFAAARSSIEVRFSLRNRFYARAIAERIKSPSEIERADQDGKTLATARERRVDGVFAEG